MIRREFLKTGGALIPFPPREISLRWVFPLRIPNRSAVCISPAVLCEKLRAWRPRGASVNEVCVEALAFRARSRSPLPASIRANPFPSPARSFLQIFAAVRCARHVPCPREQFFVCKACLLRTRSKLEWSTAFR